MDSARPDDRRALRCRGALRVALRSATLCLLLLSLAPPARAWREGPPPDKVGACGFGGSCREAGCHFSSPLNTGSLTWTLGQEAPAAPLPLAYVPGREYDLRLDLDDTLDPMAASIWGFELAPMADCPLEAFGGDVQPADPGRARRIMDLGIAYLTHSCLCPTEDPACCGYVPETDPTRNEWSFRWTAPPPGTGDVRFAMAFNAANHDGTPLFDRIWVVDFASQPVVPEEPCPLPITDLRATLAACEPASPGERRVLLTWSGAGAPFVARTTTDRAALGRDPVTWPPGTSCAPIDGAPLTFYSVAGTCVMGDEGPHR